LTERRLPGEPGIWVLVLGELFIFSIFFITIAAEHSTRPELFRQAQSTLNRSLGLVNTLLLLTSSLLVALAVGRIRARAPGVRPLLYAAMACGSGFVLVKAAEYSEKIRAGVNIASSEFFTLYFAFTGIHLAHVLLGLGVLGVLAAAARNPDRIAGSALVECGAIFWHLVALLWIVLFALFYLAR
jgi:nitric oxide reductase NorE protein